VPDAIFADSRLAPVYDAFDGERDDLGLYLSIAEELGARRVLDVGCGTGSLAVLLAAGGRVVSGVDPAAASLAVAREKDAGGAVTWIHGDATDLPPGDADLAVIETRRPERRAWEDWAAAEPLVLDVPGSGTVERRLEVTDVSLPLVSFRFTYRFPGDGAVVTSDSTLRFRDRDELAESLRAQGFRVLDVRDAPDRPGMEFVFLTQR
jgi:SAM-dependent methyltransferase